MRRLLLHARLLQALQQLSYDLLRRGILVLLSAVYFVVQARSDRAGCVFWNPSSCLLDVSIAQGKGRHPPGLGKPEVRSRTDRFPKSVGRLPVIAESEMRASFDPLEYLL